MVDFYLSVDDSDTWSETMGPPTRLAVGVLVLTVVSLACHIPGWRATNWAGYGIGAWLVPVLAISFYSIDRKRSRSRAYIPKALWNRAVSIAALASIAVGFSHAYFASQSSYYG